MVARNKLLVGKALPSLDLQLLIGIIASILVYASPSLQSIDETATAETFSKVVFPEYLSVRSVAWIRLSFATFVLIDWLETMMVSK